MKKSTNLFLLSILILFFCGQLSAQFTQKGNDINGETGANMSGRAISLSADGYTLAVGAIGNDDNGQGAGHTRIYEWNGNTWVQKGNDIDGEAINNSFGCSVSLSTDGNIVAIGAYGNSDNGPDAGHVRIYEWSGTAWVQKGIDIDGEAALDNSGWSVSLSADGNIVAVGAHWNGANGAYTGHVRVYEWNGVAWIQRGIDLDGAAAGDQFGCSVSLNSSGNILIVGAFGSGSLATNIGYVRVYEWDGMAWIQRGIGINGSVVDDSFGYAVSINTDGTVIAIGAPYMNNIGQMHIYEWNSITWVPKGNYIAGDPNFYGFGHSISLSADGNIVAVGAPADVINGIRSGQVRVYEWDGTAWGQKGIGINGKTAGDVFGSQVSLNASGSIVAIGAPNSNSNGSLSGQVSAYEWNVTNAVSTITTTQNSIKIYPNPTSGLLHIDQEKNQEITIAVFDNLGRLLVQQKTSDRISDLNINHLPTGIYLVSINNGKELVTQKVVKQ